MADIMGENEPGDIQRENASGWFMGCCICLLCKKKEQKSTLKELSILFNLEEPFLKESKQYFKDILNQLKLLCPEDRQAEFENWINNENWLRKEHKEENGLICSSMLIMDDIQDL